MDADVFIVGVWTGCSFSVRHRVVLPLQTLSNLLAALRESDFSIRARGASGDDSIRTWSRRSRSSSQSPAGSRPLCSKLPR